MAKSPFRGDLVAAQSPVVLPDMANSGDRLKQLVTEKLNSRDIEGLGIDDRKLRIRLTSRDYLVAHRGVARVYMYVSPLGKDLYASWLVTFLGKLSLLKLILFPLTFWLALFAMMSPGRQQSFVSYFRKPMTDFQYEDCNMLSATFDYWALQILDEFLEGEGIEQESRLELLPRRKMQFTAKYAKA